MNLVCLILLFINTETTYGINDNWFIKISRISQPNYNAYLLTSNTEISSHLKCSLKCMKYGCMSFAYTGIDKRCDTYSRVIDEEHGATVNMTTMYFSLVSTSSICSELPKGDLLPSGVYQVTPSEGNDIDVLSDMETAEGPWTVIQRRCDGTVDFYRNWADYKNGFGELSGEFWIGNDILHQITTSPRTLRIEIEAWDGRQGHVEYTTFQVADEDANYTLTVSGFSGNVFDVMMSNNGYPFSTKDRSHSWYQGRECAVLYQSGWWFKSCAGTNINGPYQNVAGDRKMFWISFAPSHDLLSLKAARMMIRS